MALPSTLPLALTQGDPSGIGPEIALMAWRALQAEPDALPFIYLGDPDHLARRAHESGIVAPLRVSTPAEAASVFREAIPVAPLGLAVNGLSGKPDKADAPATIKAIEDAVRLTRAGETSAVVTNPIAKSVLQSAGFEHPGHTEFLATLAQSGFVPARLGHVAPPRGDDLHASFVRASTHPVPPLQGEGEGGVLAAPGSDPHPIAGKPAIDLPLSGRGLRAVMMLHAPELAVVPVTIHIPLARVPDLLTRDLIVETGYIVAHDLTTRFGVAAPRLAVSGLNPHAGESGTMGREEIDIIGPAVAALVGAGIDAVGPLPADTMFHAAARARYDVALCMTHDQALIPIKTLAFDHAVNVTLGLPFVRTSPDHGTAFDIAGKGIANPSSLIAALRLASRLASRLAKTDGR